MIAINIIDISGYHWENVCIEIFFYLTVFLFVYTFALKSFSFWMNGLLKLYLCDGANIDRVLNRGDR